MTLKIGDLIFTGTPAGVGALNIGDELTGFIEDQKMFNIKILKHLALKHIGFLHKKKDTVALPFLQKLNRIL